MINRVVIPRSRLLPMALNYTDIRSYVFTGPFVALKSAVNVSQKTSSREG